MVVCRFYQQGRCKFGSDCRNEHQGQRSYYDDQSYSPSPQNDRYHYVKSNTSDDPKQHMSQILDIVRQDLTIAEKGGQWPLSCYAPMKEYKIISGLDDISPEELRWQMYSSREAGSIDECKRLVLEMLQTSQMKWNLLKSSSVEAYNIVQSIFQKDDSSGMLPLSPSVFGGPPAYTSSIFGGASAPSPGGLTQTSSIFGGASAPSLGGSTQTSSIFGGSTNVLPPSGLFASAATAHNSSSLFSQTPSQPPSGLFGAAAAAVSNQSLFGGAPIQPSSVVYSLHTSVPSTGLFGATPTIQSTSLFGGSTQGSSIFGSAPQTSTNQKFGSYNAPSSGSFHSNEQYISGTSDNSVYSAIADLSEEAIAEFKAQTFVMGKVPIRPPPKNLCH